MGKLLVLLFILKTLKTKAPQEEKLHKFIENKNVSFVLMIQTKNVRVANMDKEDVVEASDNQLYDIPALGGKPNPYCQKLVSSKYLILKAEYYHNLLVNFAKKLMPKSVFQLILCG